MTRILRYIGGAGVGKTTTLLRTMGELIAQGRVDPMGIGFVSFTRAARQEAAERAASQFDVMVEDLEQGGWFRTWHSIAYRQLSVGDQLLAPGKETDKWLSDAMQAEVRTTGAHDLESEYGRSGSTEGLSPTDRALLLWSLARNRLEPIDGLHRRASGLDPEMPTLSECKTIIDRYEQAKRLDDRYDFTDILGLYAGVRFSTSGHEDCAPSGQIPRVPVWFLDECQDNSRLIDRVARRVTDGADLVYLCGDPFQSIHTWAGADHTLFRQWGAERERVLDQSYRCPSRILALGEACIASCADYWDRGIRPIRDGGEIIPTGNAEDWLSQLDPNTEWLILARTNWQSRRTMAIVSNTGIPWRPVKGHGGWDAPERNRALTALCELEQWQPIDGVAWAAVLKYLPSTADKIPLLTHGFKAAWQRGEYKRPAGENDQQTVVTLCDWGATEYLQRAIVDGKWGQFVEHGREFRDAQKTWGWGAVLQSGIRIGTIHSAKGMEADNVVWHTPTSRPVQASAEYDRQGADEESRLGYVAATRTRNRLYINQERSQYRMEVPGI